MYRHISHPQLRRAHNENIRIHSFDCMQYPSGTQQENPIATTSNVVPGLNTLVYQSTNPFVGLTPSS